MSEEQATTEEKQAPKWRDLDSHLELGYPIHVGLRKGCDSMPSNLLWNLVHLLDAQWMKYLECAWKRLLEKPEAKRAEAVAELKAAVEDYNNTVRGGDKDVREAMTLYCALDLLTEDDWQGIGYYLISDES